MYNLNDTLNKCKAILDDLNINYGIVWYWGMFLWWKKLHSIL